MTTPSSNELISLAEQLVVLAQGRGVDVAEAQARSGWELSVKVRLGETELVQEAGHKSVYLRVMREGRAALTSTSDTTPLGIERCVNDAVELLELSERDEFAGPADPALLAKPPFVDLELHDPLVASIDAAEAIRRAGVAERAALSSDPRLTLSEGATFSRVTGGSALVLGTGFVGTQTGSYVSVAVAPVALDDGGKRRRGHYWAARRHLADLEDEAEVGKEAARRTLRQLGARKVKSTEAPIVFEQDIARSLVGTFAGCILGGSLWRKSSYLLDRVGTRVASDLVSFSDDPLLPRAPGSRVYDGDGLPTRRTEVVRHGMLESYLLDTYSARKMGLSCTNSGSRGGASVAASTSNFLMAPGNVTPEELIRSTARGLYVTDMMGFGFNAITGDYSRGASGFWIENGELCFPVSEVTISGNLDTMLQSIDLIANDVDLKTSIVAPTFRVSSMTIAGE
jgi:PmbA protein